MKTLSRRTVSWRKAVSDNEKLQLKAIRAQNNKLINTLKKSRYGNMSAARHRMVVQLNADRAQNKALFKSIKAHPASWRKAVNRRRKTQLKAVRAQDKALKRSKSSRRGRRQRGGVAYGAQN
jgi:hypothetical protein